MDASPAVLEIVNLHVSETRRDGRDVLRGISLAVHPGEMLGVVGESGAGKSLLGLVTMGFLPHGLRVSQGTITFRGHSLLGQSENELRRLRGRDIAMVLTGGRDSLNPMEPVGTQIQHVIRSHLDVDKATVQKMTVDILTAVGIPDAARLANTYPHELSGGMAQRILIAQAMVCAPILLIADEPTSDLDVTVAAQVLDQMKDLIEQRHAATMLLSRDLGIVAQYCDQVAILRKGNLIEYASIASFFTQPQHPYSRALLHAATKSRAGAPAERTTGVPTAAGRPLLQAAAAFPPDTYLRVSDQHIVRRSDRD